MLCGGRRQARSVGQGEWPPAKPRGATTELPVHACSCILLRQLARFQKRGDLRQLHHAMTVPADCGLWRAV